MQPIASIDPRLFVWLSPSFPVGSFAYSHGLELAADRGWIGNAAGVEAWFDDLLALGSLRNDLILLANAWRSVAGGALSALAATNDLALALQPSAERRLEAVTQGNAFMSALNSAWTCEPMAQVAQALAGDVAYCVAVGAATAAHGVDLDGALHAYAIAFVGTLASAAIRLSLVGQTDAQRVIARLMPAIETAAREAGTATLDDIGSATLRSDLASLAHETQYSRLFRS